MDWARREALIRLEAENTHPRLVTYVVSDSGDRKLQALPLPLGCSPSDLMDVFGVGVRLYFDLIRFFGGMALLGVLFSIPSFYASLAYASEGAYGDGGRSIGAIAAQFGDHRLFALVTLGARVQEGDPEYVHMGCPRRECVLLNEISSGLEVLYCLIYFYAVRTFINYSKTLALHQELESASIENYSVMMYGFEGLSKVDPEEAKSHVESAVREYANEKVRKYDRRIARAMRGKGRQVQRLGLYFQGQKDRWMQFLADHCERVADVTMIADDKGLLRELCELAPLEERVPTLRNKLAIAEKSGANWLSVMLLRWELEVAQRKLVYERERTDNLAVHALKPIGAFITFERERAKRVALELWRPTALNFEATLFQPKYAKLAVSRGKRISHRVMRAYPAPPPQDVRYENLPLRFAVSTFARRQCTCCVMTLMVVLGIILILAGVLVKNNPETFVGLLTNSDFSSSTSSSSDSSADGAASSDLADVAAGLDSALANLTLLENATAGNTTSLAGYVSSCTAEHEKLIRSAAGNPIQLLNQLVRTDSTGGLSPRIQRLAIAIFRCYASSVLGVVTSILIVVVNALISFSIRSLLGFSRYSTLTDRYMAQVSGLFLAQFINTGIILIVVNFAAGPPYETGTNEWKENHLCWFQGWGGDFFTYFSCVAGSSGILLRGTHWDFSPRWYTDVGASLCLTLLFTIAARLGVTFAVSYLAHLRAKFKTRRARTLIAMKKLLTGPDPRLPELLGKMYTFVSLVLLFSTPMPVLHVFACFYLLTIFWLDKWYLLRVCKKPTPYSDKFIGDTLWWVKWLLLLKLAMAVWAYGSVPGTMLDDALEAVRRSALGVARSAGGAGAGLINSATASSLAFLGVNSDNFLLQRVATIATLTLACGMILVVLLMLLHCICYQVSTIFIWDLLAMCCSRKYEPQGWPYENAPFSRLLRGNAPSERVRVARHADETGHGEVLVLRSDVDASCLSNCKGPISLLLYAFGLKTVRHRISSADKFRELPKKQHTITGKANMSYAPHFMPLYEAAFRYAEEHRPATSSPAEPAKPPPAHAIDIADEDDPEMEAAMAI